MAYSDELVREVDSYQAEALSAMHRKLRADFAESLSLSVDEVMVRNNRALSDLLEYPDRNSW